VRTKRIFTAAVAVVTVITMAAGCSSSNSSAKNSSAPITLNFATNLIGSGASTSAVSEQLIKEFEAKYPNVHIELQTAAGTALQSLIQLSFSSDNVPDVFNFWRPQPAFNMDKYIASGKLGDLSSLAAEPSVKDLFDQSAWTTATVDGKVWGIPLESFSVPFIVNTKVFAEAGLPLPTTWDTLVSDVAALKAKGIIPWMVSQMPAEQSNERLLDYVLDRELGNQKALDLYAGKVSFKSPEVEKALADYLSISVNAGPSDASALTNNAAIAKYFNTGQAAMMLTNSGYLPAIDKAVASDMKVIPFPTIPGGAQTTANMEKDLTALMYASAKGLADPNKGPVIKDFLKFFTSHEAQTLLANQSILVPAIGVKGDPASTSTLFVDVQAQSAAAPGDKWLGNARTPSQQQVFYPLVAQAWTGAFTATQFADQLESMFHK